MEEDVYHQQLHAHLILVHLLLVLILREMELNVQIQAEVQVIVVILHALKILLLYHKQNVIAFFQDVNFKEI